MKRFPEIDWLKGVAILGVIWIHAKPFETSWFYRAIVDRSVSLFLVLFGVTSELWWNRAAVIDKGEHVSRWFEERANRLLLPWCVTATLWWIGGLATASVSQLSWRSALATYFGYAPWIGTGWFVAMVFQLVLLFPLLHALSERTGRFSLLLAAAVTALCSWRMFDIIAAGEQLIGSPIPKPGWYYYWIFGPRAFWHVVAGIFIARAGVRLRPRVALLAAALTVLAFYVEDRVGHRPADEIGNSLRALVVARLADVPLTLALLGLIRGLQPGRTLTRFLAWCGGASWGVYLGQLLVHGFVHMLGYWPETARTPVRLLYALVLFAGGAGLTLAGAALRRRLPASMPGALRRRAATD